MVLLKTMSASALKNWESCQAYAGATSLNRVPTERGAAADLGTVVHTALQYLVEGVFINKTVELPETAALLLDLFHEAYQSMFGSDDSMYADGYNMLKEWWGRQNWDEWRKRTVLSTEVKENFEVPTPLGKIPFNFIWDRADQLEETVFEVIDYKSWRWARNHEEMKKDIQVRCYALAAQIKWKNATRIWVTLDQIRYDQISMAFTREDNIATWKWLKRMAVEIQEATEPLEETINSNCRFCPRKSSCATLLAHVAVGGDLGLDSMDAAAPLSYEIENKIKALEQLRDQLAGYMGAYFRETDTDHWQNNDWEVGMGSGMARRSVDAKRAETVIGPRLFDIYGKKTITLASVDKLLTGKELDDEAKSRLRGLITKSFAGGSKPSVSRKGSIDKD